jgi:hypothetical protein
MLGDGTGGPSGAEGSRDAVHGAEYPGALISCMSPAMIIRQLLLLQKASLFTSRALNLKGRIS